MNIKKAACTFSVALSLAAVSGQAAAALNIGGHPEHRAQAAAMAAPWQTLPPVGATVTAANYVREPPPAPVADRVAFYVGKHASRLLGS